MNKSRFHPYRSRDQTRLSGIGYFRYPQEGITSRKRGIILRINEAYEHETILPYPTEESCPMNGCNKVSTQCVDVSAPMTLTPTAAVGAVTVACQGSPCATCVADASGTSVTVTMTQQICVTVPVRYGVTMTAGEPTITCADSCTGCGCC